MEENINKGDSGAILPDECYKTEFTNPRWRRNLYHSYIAQKECTWYAFDLERYLKYANITEEQLQMLEEEFKDVQ